VVGRSAGEQFAEGALGATLACGDREFKVVGVFRAAGAARESEFWGHGPSVSAAYRREMYSSATLRLADEAPATRAAAISRVQSASVALRAIPEPEYFASQTQNARILEGLALALVVLMGAGAVFAAMNTMHAAVTARTREIGMLRALGFSRGRILRGILAESLALAAVGGALGCGACLALITVDRGSKDLVGFATFASVAFRVTFTWQSALAALGVALLIGGVGGLWPARTAARLPIVHALRTV
jgi:putative ABC transport system permease protein